MKENDAARVTKIIYCSGPLFSPGERGEMLAISRCLEEQGWDTFLPQRDGIEALVMGMVNSPLNVNLFTIRRALDRAIFALDIYQIIERCDALVMNMNGRVPDEGALVEAAVAWAAGKPLVIYKDDARTAFKGRDNSMISGLVRSGRTGSIEAIPGEVKKALGKVPGTGGDDYRRNMSGDVARNVKLGRRIWELMSKRRASKKKDAGLAGEIAALCR
ncbi:MAG: nucleoside 2-deoxyribosyltransferase [Spirochaetes bacterium]|nr:nucleoside 2-deoxyribosyltransferase [Spirochaetota bacterium]